MTDYHVNNSYSLSALSRKNLLFDRSLCICVKTPLSYAIDYNEKSLLFNFTQIRRSPMFPVRKLENG